MKFFIKLLSCFVLITFGLIYSTGGFAVSDSVNIGLQIIPECSPHGDINNDGYVDIVDFSILLYFWGQTNPSNPCADINRDGIVDIIDFSIMLYWWS